MKKISIIITVLGVILLSTPVHAEVFSDVYHSTDYKDSIMWMHHNGVIQGDASPKTTFRPDDCVNRAEMLKMLFEVTGEDLSDMAMGGDYPDVPIDAWYQPYVKKATLKGTVVGYADGKFRPEQCVNRAEAIKMTINEFGIEIRSSDFKGDWIDLIPEEWYFNFTYTAITRNIVGLEHTVSANDETDFRFHPEGYMSRKEASEMLYRMKTIVDNSIERYGSQYGPGTILRDAIDRDMQRVTDIIRIQKEIVVASLLAPEDGGLPSLTNSGCINDNSFAAYMDDYFEGSSYYVKGIPSDPISSQISYGDEVTCLGEYYYKYQPAPGIEFGLYAVVETEEAATSNCESALDGELEISDSGPFCYAVLVFPGDDLSELWEAAAKKVSDDFMNALANNQTEEAYGMTSDEFKGVADLERLILFLEEFPILTDYTSYSFDYRSALTSYDPIWGVVSGTITDSAGFEEPLTIKFVYRDEMWQVVNFSLELEDVPDDFLK